MDRIQSTAPYRRKRQSNPNSYNSKKSKHRKSQLRSSNSRSNSRDDADHSDEFNENSRKDDIRDSFTTTATTHSTATTTSEEEEVEKFYDIGGSNVRFITKDPLEPYLKKRYSNDRAPSCIVGAMEKPIESADPATDYYIRVNAPPPSGSAGHDDSATNPPPVESPIPTNGSANHEIESPTLIAKRIPFGVPRIKRQKSQTMLEMEAILQDVPEEVADSDREDSEESASIAPEIKSSRSVRFLDILNDNDDVPRKGSFVVGDSLRKKRQEEAASLVSMITGNPRASRMFPRNNSTESIPSICPHSGKKTVVPQKCGENAQILEQFFNLLELRTDKEIDITEFETSACGLLRENFSDMGPEINMKGRSRKLFEQMVPRKKRTINASDVEVYLNARIENKLQVLRMMSALRSTKHMNQKEEERLAQKVFQLLDMNQEGHIQSIAFTELLEENGLNENDYRLREFFYRLKNIHGHRNAKLSFEDFLKLIRGLPHTYSLVDMLFSKKLIVPDFPEFESEIEKIFKEHNRNDGNPFAVAICSVDGQELSFGDAQKSSAIQGIAKPLCYLMACAEHGFDRVHHHLGREPTGKEGHAAFLKPVPTPNDPKRHIPHNPFVEAGAIVACSLILADTNSSNRFSHVLATMSRICYSSNTAFCNETYLKMRASANREMCLAHMLQEYHSFPDGIDLDKTLELYFQTRALKASATDLARFAATLANSGKNPKSDDQIFDRGDVRNCLSLMLSSGMADASGLWGFDVGIPAKSGRSGFLMCVIPNKLGMVIYCPSSVDKYGRSHRAMDFMRTIIEAYNFHCYDNLRGVICRLRKKKDPTLHIHANHCKQVTDTIYACARGDLNHLTHLNATGADIFQGDYDNRTGLHLAASEGHLSICKYFAVIARKRRAPQLINTQDRWGRTPLDDAVACNHQKIADFLIRYGAVRGPTQETFRVFNFSQHL